MTSHSATKHSIFLSWGSLICNLGKKNNNDNNLLLSLNGLYVPIGTQILRTINNALVANNNNNNNSQRWASSSMAAS